MNTLFENFTFDLQRFESYTPTIVSLGDIGSSTAKNKTAGKYYWSETYGDLLLGNSTANKGTVAIKYITDEDGVYTVNDVSAITLTGSGTQNLTISSSASTFKTIRGLGSATVNLYTAEDGKVTATPASGLEFKGARASNYISLSDGAIDNIILTSGTLTVAKSANLFGNSTTAIGLNAPEDDSEGNFYVNRGFTYTAGNTPTLALKKKSSGEADTVSISAADAAYVIPDKNDTEITFGTDDEGGTYKFLSKSGSAAFYMLSANTGDDEDEGTETADGTPKGFHFGGIGDQLILDTAANSNLIDNIDTSFSYGNSYNNKFKISQIQTTPEMEGRPDPAVLEMTGSTTFKLSNMFLGDEIYLTDDVDNAKTVIFSPVQVGNVTPYAGGSVIFDAKARTVSEITVDEGGVVQVTGYNNKDVKINGGTINVKMSGNDTSGDLIYNNFDTDNPILDLNSEEMEVATSLVVNSAGDAKQLNIGNFVTSATINGTKFTLDQGTPDTSDPEAGPTNNHFFSAFVLDGESNATGFIFDIPNGLEYSGGTTTLTFESGVPSDFTFYDGNGDTPIEFLPTITGTGAVAVGKSVKSAEDTEEEEEEGDTASTESSYILVVGKGTILTFEDGTKLDFTNMQATDFAKIEIDETTREVKSVLGTITPDSKIATAVAAFTGDEAPTTSEFSAKTSIIVTGDQATTITEGISYGTATEGSEAQTYVSTGKGNYTLTTAGEDSVVLSLGENDDTIYSVGQAGQVVLVKGDGTIHDETPDTDYVYTSGGNAYLAADEGAITSFVFVDQNDAITLDDSATIGLAYLGYNGTVENTLTSPIVTGSDDYKITMTTAPKRGNDSLKAVFEVSGLDADAVVAFAEDSDSFTFSAEGGTVLFTANTETSVSGFTASEGTVTMDETAAAHMGDVTEDGKAVFSINGGAVQISASESYLSDGFAIYDADTKGLIGLGDGSTIVSAGTQVERIYVSNGSDDSENGAAYTFGDGDDSTDDPIYTAWSGANNANEGSYFKLDGGKPVGFVFAEVDDFIIFDENVDETFKLFADAQDTTGFVAPAVYDSTDARVGDVRITKIDEENFNITGVGEGDYVQFDSGTKLTFGEVSDDAGVSFNTKGELVGVIGIDENPEAVTVSGATKEILFGYPDETPLNYVKITGETSSFVYSIGEDSLPVVSEVYGNSKIESLPANVTELGTAAGTSGAGTFTFGAIGASSVYSVAASADDKGGVTFQLDGLTVKGVSGVDGAESVSGALATLESLNGAAFDVQANDETFDKYIFSGTSFAGLQNGDSVVTAGAIQDFLTAGASGTYNILGDNFKVEGDEDGVTFAVNEETLTEVGGLDANASITGSFDSVAVNGETVDISGDNEIILVGANEGIAKIGGLSGDDVIISQIGSATVLGADGDGKLTFEFTGNGEVYEIGGNSSIETKFILDSEYNIIEGLDVGESINGDFTYQTKVDGTQIQVTGDSSISVTNGASGLALAGLNDGATVVAAQGEMNALTESIDGAATFTFADGQSVAISGKDDGVTFEMVDGVLKSITGLDDTASISGDLNGIIIGSEPVISVVGADGKDNTNLTYNAGTLSGIVDGDTVYLADKTTLITAGASGTFNFANGDQTFTTTDENGIDFAVTSDASGVTVNAVSELDADATLSGNLGTLTQINGASVQVLNDDDYAVVGAAEGVGKIINVSGGASIVHAGGASQIITDSTGEFTFASGQFFRTAYENEIIFKLDGENVTGIAGLSGAIEGELGGLTINYETFDIEGDKDNFFGVRGTADETAIKAMAGVGGSAVTIKSVGSANTIFTDTAGVYTFDTSGQTFQTNDDLLKLTLKDGSVTAIESLDADNTVAGNFDGVAVNGQSIAVSGDDNIYVVGAESGISKIGGLSGENVTITEFGNASVLGMDGDGKFTFAPSYLQDPYVYEIAGTGSIETTFTYDNGKASFDGLDVGETLTAKFENEIGVEGQAIQVTGDSSISVINGASGLALAGLNDGATVVAAQGEMNASTEAIDGSATFTFADGQSVAVTGTDADGVTFQMVDGVLKSITGLDDTATVSGDLNGIVIGSEPVISVVGADGNDNTNLTYTAGTLSGIVDGDTVYLADNTTLIKTNASGTFKFANGNQSFTTTDENGIDFAVTSTSDGVTVNAISNLDAGATLSGYLADLTQINGASVLVANDDDYAVVGAAEGVGKIINVTGGASLIHAGGASQLITDGEGTFTFANGTFMTALDNEVTFELDGENATGVAGLSGLVSGKLGDLTINGETFEIDGDNDDEFYAAGTSDASAIGAIAGVGGSAVTIKSVGSAVGIITDKVGKYTFASGQEFATDDDDLLAFEMTDGAVTNIYLLEQSVTGNFDGVGVNGVEFSVTDADNKLKVIGNESASSITEIADVTAGATIENAGGAQYISTNSDGEFSFAGHSNPFVVAGDSAIKFAMDTTQAAVVIGIEDLDAPATITGELGKVAIDGVSIAIDGDADNNFSYAIAQDGTRTIGEVGGENVTINGVGSASFVKTVARGTYTFASGQSFILGANSATFGVTENLTVTTIDGLQSGEFVGGKFDTAVAVNGSSIQILNDENGTTLTMGASSLEITDMSNGAQLVAADGVLSAKTDAIDGDGSFTFVNGTFDVTGDDADGVEFVLDGEGEVVGINGLSSTATISGNLNNLLINNEQPPIEVWSATESSGFNTNLTYSEGILRGIVDGDTVVGAGDATQVVAITAGDNATFSFGSTSDSDPQSFAVAGDSSNLIFDVIKGAAIATGIEDLDEGASVVGKLNNIAINGGGSLDIDGDSNDIFGVVAGSGSGVAIVTGVGGSSVTVNSAGGASLLVTDEVGSFKFASGQEFGVRGDSSVGFQLEGDNVIGIAELSGAVTGDFTDGLPVNGELVQVEGDADGIIVSGNGSEDAVALIEDVDAGATVKAVGSAGTVYTDGAGDFAFEIDGFTAQNFTINGDSFAAFLINGESGAAVAVAGVSVLENGTLKFDAATTQIEVNPGFNDLLTFTDNEDITLTIVDSKVVGLSGVMAGVSGVQDATIAATAAITVNGDFIDITEADASGYNIIVAKGGVSKITDVDGDATVNVTSGDIWASGDGKFLIGGEEYTFTDADGFDFLTDANQKLVGVNGLSGTVEIMSGSAAFTINGDKLAVASSNAPITITSDGTDITAVDGLVSGDSVSGDLGNASIAMAGTSSTVKGEGTFLTLNGEEYQLLGDEDGVTLNGAHEVIGLDENASLVVANGGDYTVNHTSDDLDDLDAPSTIVGGENYEDAYPYDPNNLYVRKPTPIEDIEEMLGLPNYDDAMFGGPRDGVDLEPLSKAESDALFDTENPADLDQPARIWLDNKDVKETQEFDVSPYKYAKKIRLYEGEQYVKTNDDFGNEVIVDDEASGVKNIEFGDGGNAAIIDESAALDNEVNIIGGAGADTIFVRENVQVNFDASEGGADKVVTFAKAKARVNIEGYNYKTGAGVKVDERKARNIAEAIDSGFIGFGNGVLQIGTLSSANSQITFEGHTDNVGGTLVNILNPYSERQVVGFTNSGGGEVDASDSSDDVIFIGNNDGSKTGGSTLTGGAGNDTAFAGAGDVVNLGLGVNRIELEDNVFREGAKIIIESGRTTINNMNNTLDEAHGDTLQVDLGTAEVSYDGTNLIIDGDDFYAEAVGADTNSDYDDWSWLSSSSASNSLASSSDEVADDLVASNDRYTNQLIQSGDALWKSAIGAENSVMQVESDEDIRAQYYKGKDSGVTFAGYAGDAIVDLANDGKWVANSLIDGRDAVFDGVTSLKAGAAGSNDQFKGSTNSETLMGGQGDASLYGDGGNNLLMGYNGTDGDKEGQTTFLVLGNAVGAANTISGFEFVTDDNYTATEKVTADRLDVDLNTNHVHRIDISGGTDVLIEVINNNTGVTEKALIEDAVGKDICLLDRRTNSSLVAQVNTDTLNFDKYTGYYYATEKNATVVVDDANIQDNAIVWLGGEKGTEFVGDIRAIDATGFSGKAELAGNALDNTVIAGTGETSLWGGNGGDDVMYGGTGKDTFFYTYGNGTDTIDGAGEGDTVDLAATNLNQIVFDEDATGIDDDKVTLKFSDGGALIVNGTNVAFKIQGETYYADHDNKAWTKKI